MPQLGQRPLWLRSYSDATGDDSASPRIDRNSWPMMAGEKFDTPPRSGYHTSLMSERAPKVAVKLDFEAMSFNYGIARIRPNYYCAVQLLLVSALRL